MKKLAMIMACATVAGVVLWTATPSNQQSADYTGPGPMSIVKPVATIMGAEPMTIQAVEPLVAVYETPGPHGISVYKA